MAQFDNLSSRIIVSVLGVPLIIFASLIGGLLFLILFTAIAVIAFYELSELLVKKNRKINNLIGLLTVSFSVFNFYLNLIPNELLLIIVFLLFLITELYSKNSSSLENLGAISFSYLYSTLLTASIILIREYFSNNVVYFQGGYIVLGMFISIWLCDTGAYFIGKIYGNRKLYPTVSPNKSWEGAFAGFIFSVIGMLTAHFLFIDFITLTDSLILGSIIGITAQFGDLIESMFKRDAVVKDTSKILAGHGGILDRFDSVFFSAPFVYFYLYINFT